MNLYGSIATAFLAVTTCLHAQGSRLVYHNDASLPDELNMMELFIGDKPQHHTGSRFSPAAMTVAKRQEAQGSGMWFGPRLGRRKREVESSRNKRSTDDVSHSMKARAEAGSGMWFGPRLGRRKREEIAEEGREKRRIDVDGPPDNMLYPTISQEGPWTVVSYRGGQRRSVNNFTPRLGRNSEEDTDSFFMEPLYEGYVRTPSRSSGGGGEGSSGNLGNFTPRLGRLAPLEH